MTTAASQPDLVLRLRDGELAIVQLPPDTPIPAWASVRQQPLLSITCTENELSIVCARSAVPEGVPCEAGWCVFRVEGKLDFALVGILAAILSPLAEAGIPVFALSTFDTDYILVRTENLDRAIAALSQHFKVHADSELEHFS